jgi:hypothetical protein
LKADKDSQPAFSYTPLNSICKEIRHLAVTRIASFVHSVFFFPNTKHQRDVPRLSLLTKISAIMRGGFYRGNNENDQSSPFMYF